MNTSVRKRPFVLVVMMASASLGISVIGATEEGGNEEKPVKYAPAYCHNFRLNCQVKAGHVCCRFPLPPTGCAD